ncbi:MAG: glycosyltransferase family 4 protein [Desulfonatronovibrionaceae bacterium]
MHILYFHQYFNTLDAAGGTRSYEMARKLVSRGHKVTMVCSIHGKGDIGLPGKPDDPVRKGNIDGIDVIQFNLKYSNYMSLPRRAWIFMRFALKSIGLAMHMKYNLVFATTTPLTTGIPGIFASYLRRKPFVFEVRDLWPELPKAMGVVKNPLVLAGMSFLEWMSYRAATACIALSPGIKKGIASRSNKDKPIAMIPNGCDLDLFQPGNRNELDLPGIGPEDFVAVFTGAHGMANGLDAVLDAAAVLKKMDRNDIKLIFIGDGKLKPKLVQRAKDEGLTNCLFFDPVPKKRLSKIVCCCNAGMMILDDVPAFYYGTSPNKFFDYIASGLPVVNNYPGWLAGMIQEHECGLAVKPRSPEELAEAFCRLADNPELCREYGQNSRKLAEKEFSREKLSNEFADWLERFGGMEAGKEI